MSVDIAAEIELDPEGFAPRAELFARNLSSNTITFNMGKVRWELPPQPSPDYQQPLPWTVARSEGFGRIWAAGGVLVAIDPDFVYVISELPNTGATSLFKPFVFQQLTPQSTVTIQHDFNRAGPVAAVAFSLDGETEYFNFKVSAVDANSCRLSFDDPITFVATVF